jgi:tRNA (guanine-N7-)-methyltransferase
MPDPIFTPTDYFRVQELREIFEDPSKPFEIDLGCGDGEFLVEMAAHYPERNFLGVERLIGRIEKTAKMIKQSGLTNARVLRLESLYTIAWLLPQQSVSRLHLLCPDPWPKKKHEERRLVRMPQFHAALQRVLVPNGEFLLKTDDTPYFENALESFGACPQFHRLDWPEDAFFYAMTGFEAQWLALSKSIHRARWQVRR